MKSIFNDEKVTVKFVGPINSTVEISKHAAENTCAAEKKKKKKTRKRGSAFADPNGY